MKEIRDLLKSDRFSPLDRHFAALMERLSDKEDAFVALAAALASNACAQGHICVPLGPMAGQPLEEAENIRLPEMGAWRKALLESGVAGGPGDRFPLILDAEDRLYLARFWRYESGLSARLKSMGPRLQIITGGPGTGKTTMAAGIVAKLPQPVAFAAPTGKAAFRLQQSVKAEVLTLHRLLGYVPGTPYFRHNAANPLPYQAVMVDEASMVDLALMYKLVDAIQPDGRLILLGDKDQLASVEAGAVLGDICAAGQANPDLGASIIELTKSFRFGPQSLVGRLAVAINSGDPEKTLSLLNAEKALIAPPSGNELEKMLKEMCLPWISSFCEEGLPFPERLKRFNRLRLLCAVNQGPYGVEAMNLRLQAMHTGNPPARFYHGMPVMITRNDHSLGLYNGDTGLVFSDPDEAGTLYAYFAGTSGETRRFIPGRLPVHTLAYASTVHKSQGSEFDRVVLFLPRTDSPVLTKELLYTAVTRTKDSLMVYGRPETVAAAVKRPTERWSGLKDALG